MTSTLFLWLPFGLIGILVVFCLWLVFTVNSAQATYPSSSSSDDGAAAVATVACVLAIIAACT